MSELELTLEQEIVMAERRVKELKQQFQEEQCAGQKEALNRIRDAASDWSFEPVYFSEGLRRFSIDCRFGRRLEVEARANEFVLQIEELEESQVLDILKFVAEMDSK